MAAYSTLLPDEDLPCVSLSILMFQLMEVRVSPSYMIRLHIVLRSLPQNSMGPSGVFGQSTSRAN